MSLLINGGLADNWIIESQRMDSETTTISTFTFDIERIRTDISNAILPIRTSGIYHYCATNELLNMMLQGMSDYVVECARYHDATGCRASNLLLRQIGLEADEDPTEPDQHQLSTTSEEVQEELNFEIQEVSGDHLNIIFSAEHVLDVDNVHGALFTLTTSNLMNETSFAQLIEHLERIRSEFFIGTTRLAHHQEFENMIIEFDCIFSNDSDAEIMRSIQAGLENLKMLLTYFVKNYQPDSDNSAE